MGDGEKVPLRLQFNPKVRLEFHGATITSEAARLPIFQLGPRGVGSGLCYSFLAPLAGRSRRVRRSSFFALAVRHRPQILIFGSGVA